MLQDDLNAFLVDVAQRAKPATVAFYRGRSAWISSTLGALTWPELTPQKIRAALDQANRWPDGRHKAPDTQRGNTIAWEQLQKWAIETGRVERPVLDKPLAKPAGRQRDRLPAPEEITKLLDGADAPFTAIYQALLLTGARPGELCRATIADFDAKEGVIELADHKTKGKTGHSRKIPISKAARKILVAAIGDRTEGAIFLRGDKSWTVSSLGQAFRRRRTALGLDRGIVLYSTRHKFATECCHAQGIEAAAAVLGHAGLQTIRRYVHHDAEQLVKYADGVDAEQLVPPPGEGGSSSAAR